MSIELKGIVPPIITPFKEEDQEIYEKGLREQVNFLIESGVHGLFACGTSGEFFSLTSEERKRVNSIVVDETNGRVPVFAGTGSSGTKETIELTKHAKDVGADVAAIIAPYFTRTTDNGILKHYEIVTKNVDIPIFLYNIPYRAGINLHPSLVAELAKMENVVGVKESSTDMIQFAELLRLVGDKIAVLQGEDPLILESLVLGADGAVSAVANVVPRMVVNLYNDVIKNKIEEAKKKQMQINRLTKECLGFRPWPVGIKETLNMLGKNAGVVRGPLVRIDEESRKKLQESLTELKELNYFEGM